jgi:hypothetical protein
MRRPVGEQGLNLQPYHVKVATRPSQFRFSPARLGLAPPFPPEAQKSRLVIAHDNSGIRSADETPALGRLEPQTHDHIGLGVLSIGAPSSLQKPFGSLTAASSSQSTSHESNVARLEHREISVVLD